jgi:23S rRNA pseudouridine2605 synthase
MSRPPVRLQKLLAACGVASSRRHAEDLIRGGAITLANAAERPPQPLGLGFSLPAADFHLLRLGGLPLPALSASSPLLGAAPRLFAHHKPRGYITAWRDDDGRAAPRRTLTDALRLRGSPPAVQRLIHAGRLDEDSEGLLLLTTCGELALRIAHPSLGCKKRYLAVCVPRPQRPGGGGGLAAGGLTRALLAGVPLEPAAGEARHPAAAAAAALLEWRAAEAAFSACGAGALGAAPAQGAIAVSLVLADGRKRVVRRMFSALGWRVERLLRTAVGSVELGALPAGGWAEVPGGDFQANAQ